MPTYGPVASENCCATRDVCALRHAERSECEETIGRRGGGLRSTTCRLHLADPGAADRESRPRTDFRFSGGRR